jgi:hypothetical protein
VCSYALLLAGLAFPEAANAAAAFLKKKFPDPCDILDSLDEEDTAEWLNAMGWSVDYISTVYFLLMCVLGVFNKNDIKVQFASKLYHIA